MRIAHVFFRTRFEEGGTLRAAMDISRVLAARGHDVRWLTHDDTDVPEAWRSEPATPEVRTIPAPTGPLGFYTRAQARAVREAIGDSEVVHLHGIWQPTTAQSFRAASSIGVPCVLSTHGMLDDWSMAQSSLKKALYTRLVAGPMLRGVRAFHTTAEDERRQAGRRIDARRAQVIPYITDLDPFRELPGPALARERFGLDPGRPSVLYLSRLHYKKQPEVLIDAAALWRDAGQDTVLLLAGPGEDGYVASLRRRAEAAGLGEDRCRFLGMVTGELKLSLYEAADLFAMPTSQENFGLVYTEALACRTPIVATRGTDIWRELEATGGATIAEPTPGAFAEAVGGLLADREALAGMGERGRAGVFEWLEPDALAREYEAMYERAASAEASRQPSGQPAGVAP